MRGGIVNDIGLPEGEFPAVERYYNIDANLHSSLIPHPTTGALGWWTMRSVSDAAVSELVAALRDIHDELFRYKQLAERDTLRKRMDDDYTELKGGNDE